MATDFLADAIEIDSEKYTYKEWIEFANSGVTEGDTMEALLATGEFTVNTNGDLVYAGKSE